jgi:hypothetical protein
VPRATRKTRHVHRNLWGQRLISLTQKNGRGLQALSVIRAFPHPSKGSLDGPPAVYAHLMAATSTNQTLRQYYALSGVQLDFDSFDLGHGVVLSQTYLHVMSPPLIAFAPCSESKPHPTPWRTANVKPRHMEADLFAQLSVPRSYGSNEHYEWASWIVLLLRFANDVTVNAHPYRFRHIQRSQGRQSRSLSP